MTERPIIFSGPMVRAILAGTKTQTRRPITKPVVLDWLNQFLPEFVASPENHLSPYGHPGDRLWVRETAFFCNGDDSWVYRADGFDLRKDMGTLFTNRLKWRPAIHMPRTACRLLLDVVAVRIERLQDLTEEDAKAEGIALPTNGSHVGGYAILWDSLNAKRAPWSSNPWVWVIEFKREGKC